MIVRSLLIAAWFTTGCQIQFDLPAAGGGSGGQGSSVDGASTAAAGSAGSASSGSAGLGGTDAALLGGPIALWTFSGTGRPAVVEDRVGQVPLFPYPLGSTDAAIRLEGGALVLSGASLKSDLEPATPLIRPLAVAKEFSLELWAKMGPEDFAGKHVLFKTTGSNFFNFNQFVTGAAFEVPIQSTTDGGLFLGDHRGQTRHWVGTFSGSARVVRLFIDGDVASTRDLEGPIEFADEASRVEIGDQLWQGQVFLAALYNRVLAASEVRALYVAGWQR